MSPQSTSEAQPAVPTAWQRLRYRARVATYALRRLTQISRKEWEEMLSAQRALVHAQWSLRRRPVGQLVHFDADAAVAVGDEDLARARAWARAVARASDYGVIRAKCLARSLALVSVLERERLRGARIRAGVRIENDALLAHAWVEFGGIVISDHAEYVAQFEPFTDLRMLSNL